MSSDTPGIPVMTDEDQGYIDARHPNVQSAGRRILARALAKSAEADESLDALWEVFRDHVRKYELAEAISREINGIRDNLVATVKADYMNELREAATEQLRQEIEGEVREKLEAQYTEQLTPLVQAEIKQLLIATYLPSIRQSLVDDLRRELTYSVRLEVRKELVESPELQAEAIKEIKRRIAGLGDG
jgi:FKBP-type peptidyl-prolyl cis-trans isomerase (trigger factor)